MKQIRSSIVKAVSKSTKIPQKFVKVVVNVFLDLILDAIGKGDEVELRDFGSFKTKKIKSRKLRPFGHDEMILPEKTKPVLKFSRNVHKRLNPKKDDDLDL